MASGVYARGIWGMCSGAIDWDTDTIRCQLTSSSYTPNFDTDDYRDDVTAYQIGGTSDQTMPATLTVGYDAGNNYVYLDCGASVTFSSVASGTCAGVVVYKSRGGASSADELICWLEFSSPVTANGSDIQVNFNSSGAIRFTY